MIHVLKVIYKEHEAYHAKFTVVKNGEKIESYSGSGVYLDLLIMGLEGKVANMMSFIDWCTERNKENSDELHKQQVEYLLRKKMNRDTLSNPVYE